MAKTTGESFFSYPLSRPYPFVWFTYAVTIGGIICTVLFSFVALAADGYYIESKYETDLNGTMSKPYWFKRPPFSWISPTQVSYQPALLTSGSSYFTGSLGFTYTIDKLWHEGSNKIQNRILPATEYSNALLEECRVVAIEINLLRRDQTMTKGDGWSWGATTASATVNCAFQTSNGSVRANLTTQLPSTNPVNTQSLILASNVTRNADMWFGGELTLAWYSQLPLAMSFEQIPPWYDTLDPVAWDSGTVVLFRNPDVTNYTSLSFFFASAYFYASDGGLSWIQPPNTTAVWANSFDNSQLRLPNIATTIDTFAKCLHSLLLSDFGVHDETNALITPSGVEWLQSQVDPYLEGQNNSILGGKYSGRPESIPNPFNDTGPWYPIEQVYQSVFQELGKPPNLNSTNGSTIYTQYLCSVPRRKGAGALFFSILLADLVFLQAVWTVLNLAATWWLERNDEEANYCQRCKVSDAPAIRRKVSDYQLLQVHSRASSTVSLPVLELSEDGFFATGRESRQ